MALDLTKKVEDILEDAKTAELEELRAALTTEEAKAEPERRTTLITGLQKLIAAGETDDSPTPSEEDSVAKDENPALKGLKSVSVRVNPAKNLTGAAFYDPAQKVTIRDKAVSVKRTKFIQQKLANEELIED